MLSSNYHFLTGIIFFLHVVELPVAITSFKIASDWGYIETEGPLHCVLDVEGFPGQPFGSGTFQNVFKASCIVPNKFLDLTGRYVLKQQRLECPLTTEAVESLSTEDMDQMDDESNRKSAKVQERHTIRLSMNRYNTRTTVTTKDYLAVHFGKWRNQ